MNWCHDAVRCGASDVVIHVLDQQVSYLEDVKQLSLDSIRRFVFKQLGAKRRKNRSSNEDASPQSPGAQKNGKDGGHKSNPSRNTSPENASPPVPKVNYTSLISINYYQSFTALRERIAVSDHGRCDVVLLAVSYAHAN